jgi:diadenosine tetraphosphate (Ap4A) HIT family hydrolase
MPLPADQTPHPAACDLCAAIDPDDRSGPLRRHLRPEQPSAIARCGHAAAVPTIGAFVPGYLLIVPNRHATSLGQLPRPERAAVHAFADQIADRLSHVYRQPVLGFEYGLNMPGGRRIEHGHLHLLPSAIGAALRQYLRFRLPLIEVESLEHLPDDPGRSYISVWEPGRPVSIYPVANHAHPRIRLREIVAALEPRVQRAWDWQADPCTDLIQATVDDITAATPNPAARKSANTGQRVPGVVHQGAMHGTGARR